MSAFHFSIKLDSSVTHLRAFTATKLTAFGVKPGATDSTTSIIQKWESTSAIDPHSFADMDDEDGYSYFENENDDAFNRSIFTQSQYVDYFPENAIYNQHKAALIKLFYDREIQLLNPITMLPLDFSTPNVEINLFQTMLLIEDFVKFANVVNVGVRISEIEVPDTFKSEQGTDFNENPSQEINVVNAEPSEKISSPGQLIQRSVHSTKKRRDLLSPLIELAQSNCLNPQVTAEVWSALLALTDKRQPPLLGPSEDGIKWQDSNDEIQFLSIKNLRDRLSRSKKKAR